MPKYPRCKDKRWGCFAREAARCVCLSDTDFDGRPCPFYKKAEDMPDYETYCKRYKKIEIGGTGNVGVFH